MNQQDLDAIRERAAIGPHHCIAPFNSCCDISALFAALKSRDEQIARDAERIAGMEKVVEVARTIQDAYPGEGGYCSEYDDLQAAIVALDAKEKP